MRREEETEGTPEGEWCAKELSRDCVSFDAGEWERIEVVERIRCCAEVLLRERVEIMKSVAV